MPLETIFSEREGGSLHRSLHRIGQKMTAILWAFTALYAKLPVLSGTFDTQRVVAGTLGEPPTRSRQVKILAYLQGFLRCCVRFATRFASVFFEKSDWHLHTPSNPWRSNFAARKSRPACRALVWLRDDRVPESSLVLPEHARAVAPRRLNGLGRSGPWRWHSGSQRYLRDLVLAPSLELTAALDHWLRFCVPLLQTVCLGELFQALRDVKSFWATSIRRIFEVQNV
jgi:hypothetical protein